MNIKKLTASKQATITLLEVLHLSRNKCIFFLDASNVGMLRWTWWVMTANIRCPGQVVYSSPSKIIGHMQSLPAWLSEIPPWLWCIHGRTEEKKNYIFNRIFLVMAVGGRPNPELCFLSERLRWTLLPEERYVNSLSGCGSSTQPSNWEADILPLSYCKLINTCFKLSSCQKSSW